MKAMADDKRANELYEESMKIITPGSIVFGDFSNIKETP
jgi:large subunit ribosomal protein L17